MRISRRTLLGGGLLAVGATATSPLLEAYCVDTTEALERVDRSVVLEDLPVPFRGYRIGLLTDLHLGPYVRTEFIESALKLAIDARPDLLILGGDLIWIPDDPIPFSPKNKRFTGEIASESIETIFETLRQLLEAASTPDGTYVVMGNHDNWLAPIVGPRILSSSRTHMLINEAHRVTRGSSELWIVGVDDYWTGFPILPTLPQKSSSRAGILVSHNPDYVAETPLPDLLQLSLCGHTHGGQIRFPLIGPLFSNVAHRELAWGQAQLAKHTVYTSRGIGVVGVPYRMNCRPEVTIIELQG